MPYVTQEVRDKMDSGGKLHDAGALNYQLTRTILEYLGSRPRYKDFNDVLGALEGCKLEVYRRACAPYEDEKAAQNGDLPWPE